MTKLLDNNTNEAGPLPPERCGPPRASSAWPRQSDLGRIGLSASRFRRGMIQLAWRFLMFQKNSTLAQWFRARTENARGTRSS